MPFDFEILMVQWDVCLFFSNMFDVVIIGTKFREILNHIWFKNIMTLCGLVLYVGITLYS